MPRPMRKGGRDRRGRGRYFPKRKVCIFCADKSQYIDYKNVQMLLRFISDRGRIEPRRKTGVCPKHQRTLSQALKRARYMALLPYNHEHARQSGIVPSREYQRSGDRYARSGGGPGRSHGPPPTPAPAPSPAPASSPPLSAEAATSTETEQEQAAE